MEAARPARVDDLDDAARLWRHAVDDLGGQRGGRVLAGTLARQDLHRQLGEQLRDPDGMLTVGTIDEVVVGLASAQRHQVGDDMLAVLDVIFVEPAARGVGVGESMLGVVVSWALDHGCSGFDAPALPGNRAAKSFFERMGFQSRLLVMHRSIEHRPHGSR